MLKERLRAVRRERNLTQDDVAAFLGIKRQSYSAYERGTSVPDALTLLKLAEYFDVSTDYLLSNDDSVAKPEPEDIKELAESFELLDKKGKTLVMAELYRQLERCAAEAYGMVELAQGRKLPLTRSEAMKQGGRLDE